ncbi:hypothetical protein KV278_004891, partial [Escherichia coli]|nr:hypothetical protein [Escherichia coli]EHS3445150.1 hypothetical protein [Escherichia coli]EHS3566948.1 hypothetical protein [Escherichia coli]EHS3571402.1 hypothetical protein [Escherichia coli]EHS3613001.1 hypothetical protein [Escherichia coli]
MLALLHISNGGVRQLQLTDFFIALRFVSDGVIAVMVCCQTQRTTDHQQNNGKRGK